MSKPRNHLHLLDYIRCILYLAIASFHFVSIVWIDKGYAFSSESWLWTITEQYARTFVYSGQIILCLTFALMAYRPESKPKLRRIILGSALGAVLMAVADFPDNQSLWIWDIYPLVLTGALTLYLTLRLTPKAVYLLSAIGLTMLCFRFWELLPFENLGAELRYALVGDCTEHFADWPLLPWLGLIWFSFGIGRLGYVYRDTLKKFHRIEIAPAAAILVFGIWHFNSYRRTPTNVEWACFVFRRSPVEFLSQLFLYVFLFRLALLENIQLTLAKRSLTQKLGGLRFSTNFGLFYLVHYILMASAFYFVGTTFKDSALNSFFLFAALPVLAEFILRAFIRSKNTV
jgi:hypothetical protein